MTVTITPSPTVLACPAGYTATRMDIHRYDGPNPATVLVCLAD